MDVIPKVTVMSAIFFTSSEIYEVLSGKDASVQLLLVSIISAALVFISFSVRKAEHVETHLSNKIIEQ